MYIRNRNRRPGPIVAVAAVILALGASAGVALAFNVSGGGAQLRIENRSDEPQAPSPGVAWMTLPNSSVNVNVPAGTTRLINARFTAGSTCFGGGANDFCRVRIMANAIELQPTNGFNYHFDSNAAATESEGHAMERSKLLGPGAYNVRVEYSVSNAAMTFLLGHWHHAVTMAA
jgi:hypothetical protein